MLKNSNKILLVAILCILSLNLIYADDPVNPVLPRKCYSCEGINCQRTSRVNVTAQCSDLLDICVTVFEGYAVTARGCYLDMPQEQRNKCDEHQNPECSKCFGQLCNNKGRADFRCIECNSNDNSKCSTDTSAMTAAQCPIPTATNSYCYVRTSNANVISRGCFAHLQEQMDCMKSATCSMCLSDDGEACNSYKLNSNSGAIRRVVLNVGVMLSLLLVNLLR